MVILQVQHFLTEEGIAYFPEWLSQYNKTVRKYRGFVSLSRLTDLEDKDALRVMVTFKNLAFLRTCVVSDGHNEIIEKLAPFRLTHHTSQIFKAEGVR